MKRVVGVRWLANLNRGYSHFLIPSSSFLELICIFLYIIIVKIHCAHKMLVYSKSSQLCQLTIESVMIIILWAHNPIHFEHMMFWYPSLEPQRVTYHSSIGVQLGSIIKLGTSTLLMETSFVVHITFMVAFPFNLAYHPPNYVHFQHNWEVT